MDLFAIAEPRVFHVLKNSHFLILGLYLEILRDSAFEKKLYLRQKMISKKPFYFLRHGETDWNCRQLCQGQKDIPLNSVGRLQAVRCKILLSGINFVSICYSPLKRAAETAKIIAEGFPSSNLYPISELKERAFGSLEGKSSQEMYLQEEREIQGEINCNQEDSRFETRISFEQRVEKGINQALEKSSPVLIVSHGRVFYAISSLLGVSLVKQLPHEVPIYCVPCDEEWNFLTNIKTNE